MQAPPIPRTPRVLFRFLLLALSLMAVWRLWISCVEYDTGPFVSVHRSLIDQAPFWSLLSLLLAGYLGWHRHTGGSVQALTAGVGLLGLTAADLAVFNGNARDILYSGSWTGEACVASDEDEPWTRRAALTLTFSPDLHVLASLNTLATPIYRGSWELTFDPLLCNQKLTMHKFGMGNYWNREDLQIRGTFMIGDRSYRISAQLKNTRKGRA